MKITKASGKKQAFKGEKIIESSRRAGATKELAEEVLEAVKKNIKPGRTTEKIYDDVLGHLAKRDSRVATKYSLKKAIMRLGPAGYVFERYLGAILAQYGYTTSTGVIVKGHCISHEVDVIAQKNNVHIIVEAKYHNRPGIHSGAKDALYTWSRFQDIEKRMNSVEKTGSTHTSWLVTNTKVSQDVKDYAKCVGMKVLSWRYPKGEGLEHYIESKGLYPITIVPSLRHKELEKLSRHKTIFAIDLLHFSPEKLARTAGMKKNKAEKVIKEINSICLP